MAKKKKEFFEELPTKECPKCGEMCMEEAEVCDNCGYRFEQETTEDEALDFDELFSGFEIPGEPSEEASEGVEEELSETPEDIPEDTSEEASDDTLRCPNCNAEITAEDIFCPSCRYQLKEPETAPPVSPLLGIESFYRFANRNLIDFSCAIPGEETIVRMEGDKCIAVMAPVEVPVKVINVTEKEAEMLKADHKLRCQPQLTIKEVVDAGYTLKNSDEYLEKYYGNTDIDGIYGQGISNYANVKSVADELLLKGLSVDVLEILKVLSGEEQKRLANVLDKMDVKELTRASAVCIVDGEKTDSAMTEIVAREQVTRNLVNEMIAKKTNA